MKKFLPIFFLLLSASLVYGQESPAPTPTPAPIVTPAPNAITITAIPPRLELSALPGATLQETIKIRNESTTEMAFDVSANDFIVNDNQGTPIAIVETVSNRWSLASWITASPKKILLQPQQTSTIDLVISLPKNALPGGHYAMITYSPNTEGLIGVQNSGSTIIQKVGSLIYLNVVGDVTEAANLKTFTVDKTFKSYGPTAILAEIENLGDIHLQPKGRLTVSNLLNQVVFSEELEAKNIFPFASRLYNFSFPGKWHLGRYAARLNATAGSSQLPINGLIYFWIVPVKELAAAAVILIAIILLIVLKTRKKQPPETTPIATA
ncbi:MAG: hypothetical protein NTZ93_00050 [Candidatus Beckwithbacteria bacterium]|nr:hypothetical protein [Candidatus Beckwithbacteria bacterium]